MVNNDICRIISAFRLFLKYRSGFYFFTLLLKIDSLGWLSLPESRLNSSDFFCSCSASLLSCRSAFNSAVALLLVLLLLCFCSLLSLRRSAFNSAGYLTQPSYIRPFLTNHLSQMTNRPHCPGHIATASYNHNWWTF